MQLCFMVKFKEIRSLFKNIITVCLCLLFMYSCCKDDKLVKMPDSQKYIYKNGDTIIYKSNLNNLDTFYVSAYSIGSGDCINNEDWCKTKTCWESESMWACTKNNVINNEFNKSNHNSSLIKWNGLKFYLSKDYPIIQSLNINGVNYSNVYFFSKGQIVQYHSVQYKDCKVYYRQCN